VDYGDLVCAGISSSYTGLYFAIDINNFFLRAFFGPLNGTALSSSRATYFCIFV